MIMVIVILHSSIDYSKGHIPQHGSDSCTQLSVKSAKLQDAYAYFNKESQNVKCWAIDTNKNNDVTYNGIKNVDSYCGDVAGSYFLPAQPSNEKYQYTSNDIFKEIKPIPISQFTVNLFELNSYDLNNYAFDRPQMGQVSYSTPIVTCIMNDFDVSSNFLNDVDTSNCRYYFTWNTKSVFDTAKKNFVDIYDFMDFYLVSLFVENVDLYAQIQLKDLMSYPCISAGAHNLKTVDDDPLVFSFPFSEKVKYILDHHESEFDDEYSFADELK